jgi:WD40 repeat protein
LKGHTDKVYAVAFSQQKLILASGSADGIIKLWKLEKTQNGAVKLIENDENPQTLELLKPYHGMNISGIKGLNEAEKQQLINLGAKE